MEGQDRFKHNRHQQASITRLCQGNEMSHGHTSEDTGCFLYNSIDFFVFL